MNENINIDKLKKIARRIFNTSLAAVIIGFIFVVVVLWSMCFRYVQPYEYGIKQLNIPYFIGQTRGIQKQIYTSGLYFVMPFGFEEMHILPKNIQVLNLTNSKNESNFRTLKAAHIQTSDGFYVDVDVSILYKIVNPIKVIKTIGLGTLYEDNGIIPKAEPVLKDALGTLTTEDFYNSPKRVEKMLLAKTNLNKELKEKGIEVEQVLIRYFQYSYEIQKNIEEKKLKDQLVFKNQAETKAAVEAAKLAKTIQEGEAAVKVKLEEGNAYKIRKVAEKDLYVRKKAAEGDLLIKLAEAKKTELKNTALKVKGSENKVGLEMAKVLQGVEVIVLPTDGKSGLNPLDLNQYIKLFE